MATPATQIAFTIIDGEFPSYGPRNSDITRPGDTTQRFLYEGDRGERLQLKARRHFMRQADARAFAALVEGLQGQPVWIEDRLNVRRVEVFLHAVRMAPLQRIVSTDGSEWSVIATLDVQRIA